MELRILNKDFVFMGEIDDFTSISIQRKYRDIETITIKISADKANTKHLKKGVYVFPDNQYWKIFRIYQVKKSIGNEGVQIEAVGKSMLRLLKQRITIPPDGKNTENYTAATDDIAKRYINSNCISSLDDGMNFDFLLLTPERSAGSHLRDESRYKNLADEVIRLCAVDDMGFKSEFLPDERKVLIDIYKGADRSAGNQEGNTPVIFGVDYDNLKAADMEESELDAVNYVLVAGQGEGAERTIATVDTGREGVDRHCLFVDARDIDDEEKLTNRGLEKISNPINSIDADVDAAGCQQYERDFDLGDLVTVVVGETSIDTRITEIAEVYAAGQDRQINVIFGDAPKSIRDAFKDTNDRLTALETR